MPIVVVLIGIAVYFNSDMIITSKIIDNTSSKSITKELQNKGKEISKSIEKTTQQAQKVITEVSKPQQNIEESNPTLSLSELKQIALDDINKYRKEKGLRLLTLGSAVSPQRYSKELLIEGCIHHISDRGEGPMLRYKNNGDKMFLVAENIAGGLGTRWNTPQDEVLDGNRRMMFEDADSNWGHRDNILGPNHVSVSIGISYDTERLIMVQDFESVLTAGYQYDPSSFMKEPVDKRFCW